MRVAVIGAGAAGLVAARNLQKTPELFNFTVFEQTNNIGGTWVYTETTGKNEFGLPVHTSMYKSLRTNLPKEVMGFLDFPIPARQKSYLPAKEILDFLHHYAHTHKLKKNIRFLHHVKSVYRVRGVWKFVVIDLSNDIEYEEDFEAVMVCNGHYSTPFVPEVAGANGFRGMVLHSHDYRTPDVFQGKRVVVLGAGPSGMDLTLEISKEAKQVIMSHHYPEKIDTVFPENVIQKPDIIKMESNTLTFKDGTTAEIDAIFYCTGYLYNFPFLDESSKIIVDNNHVKPLFKHIINIEEPSMFFIGLPFYVCAFPLFDLQVQFCIRYLNGSVLLPTKKEMYEDTKKEVEKRLAQGLKNKQMHMMGNLQGDYYNGIADAVGIKRIPKFMIDLHNESSQRFLDDLVHYRDDVYKVIDDDNYVRLK